MVVPYTCPRCHEKINTITLICEHCGVDLALAAILSGQKAGIGNGNQATIPMTPEILVPRMGDYLVENGLLSQENLDNALKFQQEREKSGTPLLLGQALRELNYIDTETLDQVVTVQILQLQNALDEKNRLLEQRVQERTQELKVALDKLTELNQFRANFIANISHELRTPFTLLKGYLDILASGGFGEISTDQSKALEKVLMAEDRLETLIEDLIQFAMAQRGELSLNLKAVMVIEMFEVTLRRYAAKAKAANLTLRTALLDNLPQVRCDKEKISWVLMELVGNAIKFSPDGGKVLVEAEQSDEFVTISVTDTGIGIPTERLNEIFEPFHQLDGSATRRYGGTGLGLALSNRIIEAHGAHFKVRSVPGKGSRFEFSLPVYDGAA